MAPEQPELDPMLREDQDIPAVITDLAAEYEILGELGRGGMAVVYLARDRELHREVAIKVIRAQYVDDEEAMTRFAREARTVAQLHHPRIVEIHSIKRLADGSLALVMQHVSGTTLKEAIRREGGLPVATVERVLEDVGDALAAAHKGGIVHRDVKPENILLDEETGRALLFDFGIARSVDSRTQLTLTGMALGTPAYMSPEQIDGEGVDGRSDIYSLGLVAWEMLTGKRPWEGEGLYSVIYKQKNELLPPVAQMRRDAPEPMQIAVEGALQKDPALRWATAEDFLAQLLGGIPGAPRWSSNSSEAQRREVVAAVHARRVEHASAGAADAPTLRYRRDEVPPSVAMPPAGRWRRGAVAAAVLVLLSSAAVIGAMAMRDGAGDAPEARPAGRVAAVPIAPAPEPFAPAAIEDDDLPDSLLVLADSALPDSIETVDTAALLALLRDSIATTRNADSARAAAASLAAAAANAEPALPQQPAPAPPPRSQVSPVRAAAGSMVAGGMHSCVLAGEGQALCWGSNDRGQLGSGGTGRRGNPAPIAGGLQFANLDAGLSHTCGVTRDGAAYCWGANDQGQLGDASSQAHATPARVSGGSSFQQIWAGTSHTCALAAGGSPFCWGANDNGQLGDGSRLRKAEPSQARTSRSFATLALGWKHTCGLTGGGEVLCWGKNASGQLGDGTTADRSTPVEPAGGARFTRLATGAAHTCGISGGNVLCWGANTNGQLGDGTRQDRTVPTAVPGGNFTRVSAGSAHTCGLAAGGELLCWGRNNYGQLGDGTNADRVQPTPVAGGHRFASVSANGAHTCGTTTAGTRLCWGYNVEGQLGDGTTTHRNEPTAVQR